MHLKDETIRLFLDGELAGPKQKQVQAHLSGCENCGKRAEALFEQKQYVHEKIVSLIPDPTETPRSASEALSSLSLRNKEANSMNSLRIRRPVWAVIVSIILVCVMFSFPSVRAMASELLQLFRVEQVTVFPLDTLSMNNIQKDPSMVEAISQIFSDSITLIEGEPEDSETVSTASAAGELASYQVRIPTGDLAPEEILVKSGFSFEFSVDRKRIQEIIDLTETDLVLPEELDQALIQVDIPALVSVTYGDCRGTDPDAPASAGSMDDQCMVFVQAPSPIVTSPPELDPSILAEIGMQVLGVSSDEAIAFAQAADWTTTLVLPIPRGDVDYEEVSVDGVQGHLLRYNHNGDPAYPEGYTLLWLKDEIVYGINSNSNVDLAYELVAQLEE